jgi:2-polyprenyl-3-methyl-5-hydroxy-6-metoxy-1,4-benzoquinol methylase
MGEPDKLFTDGEAYDRLMGRWSRIAAEAFLNWLDPPNNLRWLDVGCGNGAFTEELIARCAPAAVTAIDPSDDQIAYARTRSARSRVEEHCIPNIEFVRWHRFALSGRVTAHGYGIRVIMTLLIVIRT